MAYESVTYIGALNIIGNQREDIGTWTAAGTSGQIRTRLTSIDEIHIQTPGGTYTGTAKNLQVYPNSASASFTEDDPGVFHAGSENATTVYYYRCVGR